MAWSEPLACAASVVLSRLQVLHRTLPLSARQKLGSIVLPFTSTLPLPWPEIAPEQVVPEPGVCAVPQNPLLECGPMPSRGSSMVHVATSTEYVKPRRLIVYICAPDSLARPGWDWSCDASDCWVSCGYGIARASSISWRSSPVAASRALLWTVFELALSIRPRVVRTPIVSTRAAIMTSISVNPRWHATLRASIPECVGRRRARLYRVSAIPALGGRMAGGTRRGGPGGPPRRSCFVTTRVLPVAAAGAGALAGGGAAARDVARRVARDHERVARGGRRGDRVRV